MKFTQSNYFSIEPDHFETKKNNYKITKRKEQMKRRYEYYDDFIDDRDYNESEDIERSSENFEEEDEKITENEGFDELEYDYETYSQLSGIDIDKLREVIDHIKSERPTLSSILNANISTSKRAKLFGMYKSYMEETNPMVRRMTALKIKEMLSKTDLDSIKQKDWNKVKKLSSHTNTPIKSRIINSKLSIENKAVIYNVYKDMNSKTPLEQSSRGDSEEYQKCLKWINVALLLPGSTSIDVGVNLRSNIGRNEFLYKAQSSLDKQLYGMSEIKMELLMILNNRITNIYTEKILALNGAPGTGKTMIANTLANISNLPFVRIPLGGITDASYLNGHCSTYIGAVPGMIVQALHQMKCNNGIIFLDEIDKIESKEVIALLLHVLDPSQNYDFHDKYLNGMSVDLSKIWFIVAMNDKQKLDHILADRLRIIDIPSYTTDDKIHILQEHIIPEFIKKFGLDIRFTDDVCRYIILSNKESQLGIRKLRNDIETITNKIYMYKNVKLTRGVGDLLLDFSLPGLNADDTFTITRSVVDMLLKQTPTDTIDSYIRDTMYI